MTKAMAYSIRSVVQVQALLLINCVALEKMLSLSGATNYVRMDKMFSLLSASVSPSVEDI